MNNQAKVDANLLSLYRQLWRLSQEDIALFCARYGVSDAERQLLVAPSAPKIKTLLPVIAVES